MINGESIFNSIKNIENIINSHKEEIEKLDQEIGDGDHILSLIHI